MRWITGWLLILSSFELCGQVTVIDSLRASLSGEENVQRQVDILTQLSFQYTKVSLEKSREVALEALQTASAIPYQKGIGDSYNVLGIGYSIGGAYDKGLEYFLKALKIREEQGDVVAAAKTINNLAGIFIFQKKYQQALEFSERSYSMLKAKGVDPLAMANAQLAIGQVHEAAGDSTKALQAFRQALQEFRKLGNTRKQGEALLSLSHVVGQAGNHKMALEYCFQAMTLIDVNADYLAAADLYLVIAQLYADDHKEATSLHYLLRARDAANRCKALDELMKANRKLSAFYQARREYDSALYYHQQYTALSEETFSNEMAGRLALLEKVYESEKKDQLLARHSQQIASQRWIITAIAVTLLLALLVAFLLYRINLQKKTANDQLRELNRQVSEQNEEISMINDSLEKEVQRRTEKIRQQNEKLIEYAFFNAHRVRGPLARILGLTMLIDRDLPPEEVKDLNEKIKVSAQELDTVVREIGEKLSDEV
jgi:tetratricopeptide (TPR) repeat protein